jgi:hypothetical protein
MAYTTHDHWTKVFQMGLAQGFCLMDFKLYIYIYIYIYIYKSKGKKNLVEFTLNIKYTKNPHENIFKTQQHLGTIKTNGCPNDWD